MPDREWQMTLQYNVAGEYCYTTWYMWEVAETSVQNPALVLGQLFNADLLTVLLPCLSFSTTVDSIYIRRIRGPQAAPATHLLNITGSVVSDPLPVNSTVVCTWYARNALDTGRVWRRSNGFSGAAESHQASGLLNSLGQSKWSDFCLQWFAGLTNTGPGGGVWYPIFNGDSDPIDRQVKTIVARPNLSTRRSRRRRPGVS